MKIANRARCAYACILTMLKCALRYLHLSGFDFLGASVARSASLKISHTHRIWVLAEFELWLRLGLFRIVLIVLYSQPLAAVNFLFNTWEVVVLGRTNGTVMLPALLVVRRAATLLVLY